MPEHQQVQQSTESKSNAQKQVTTTSPTQASNPYFIIQCAKINPKSLTHADIMQLQRTIGNRAVGMLLSCIRSSSTAQQATVQRQEIPEEEEPLQTKMENNTGMPDNLKVGVENLSGINMSDVRVHYNSSKPAEVGALAYTQGTNIHVAPGQDRHLPHEAWHVVQQMQGRVRPTIQLKDVAVNDDERLENEADVMGTNAVTTGQDIFSRQGVYQSRSQDGQELNAYELTHVAKQCASDKSDLLNSFPKLSMEHHKNDIQTIQCLVDRNLVQVNATTAISTLSQNANYEQVLGKYNALLNGLDEYHLFMNTNIVQEITLQSLDGINSFRNNVVQRISQLRTLCMNLTLADDDGVLDQLVVNYVLRSLNMEERTIRGITKYFLNLFPPIIQVDGWTGQFTGKSYSQALRISEFTLPLYLSGNYLPERAFVRSSQGSQLGRSMPKRGYKLHVSIDQKSMIQARNNLLPFLQMAGYQYKIVANHADMTDGQTGKIITIYPNTMEEVTDRSGFNKLIDAIEGKIENWGLLSGLAVPGELCVGYKGFIYLEENAQYR